jgi:hypothetical protein
VKIQEEGLPGGVGGWDNEVLEKSLEFFVVVSDNLVPMGPLAGEDIVEVVPDLARLWDLEVSGRQ